MLSNILIVEDEPLLSARLRRFLEESKNISIGRLTIKSNLSDAQEYIALHEIDLLFLDLNLHGKNGFDLIESAISEAFQTIVVSAHEDRAIKAFEIGVLDFIAKPFNQERVEKAILRFTDQTSRATYPTKYLAIKKNQRIQLIRVDHVAYLKGAGNYTEIHLKDQKMELHSKPLQSIHSLLPITFERIHKSYIVNLDFVAHITTGYAVHLKNEVVIPISRSKYAMIKERFS